MDQQVAGNKFDVTGHRKTEYKRGAFVINEDAGEVGSLFAVLGPFILFF